MQFKREALSRFFGEKSRLVDLENALSRFALILNFAAIAFGVYWLFLWPDDRGLMANFALAGLAVNTLFFLGTLGLRARWQTIERLSHTDETTGIFNRLYFEKVLDQEVRRAGRYHYPLSLCLLDLDNFRAFNESFGRGKADGFLRDFATYLRGNVRFTDCAARHGSDEFAVLLPHTDLVRAEKFVSRLLAQTQERLDSSFSAGITVYQAGENRAQFVMRAGLALTQAKREGKKRIRCLVGGQDSHSVLNF